MPFELRERLAATIPSLFLIKLHTQKLSMCLGEKIDSIHLFNPVLIMIVMVSLYVALFIWK